MNTSSRIICVGTGSRVTEALSTAFDDRGVTPVGDAADIETADSVDCIVVDAADAESLEERLSAVSSRDPAVPVVAFASREWAPMVRDLLAAGATDVVRRAAEPDDDDVSLLAQRIKQVANDPEDGPEMPSAVGERSTLGANPGFDAGDRIERLRDLASGLEDAESTAVVYEMLIERADRVFSFDACAVADVAGDELAVRAGRGPTLQLDADSLDADAGIVGRTIDEGRTITVDDVREVAWARPTDDSYRAVLSVPLGEEAAFQLISTTPGAYDETDRWFAELLCTIAEHAVGRTASEAVLTAERDGSRRCSKTSRTRRSSTSSTTGRSGSKT